MSIKEKKNTSEMTNRRNNQLNKERVIVGCLIFTESLHPQKRFDLDWLQTDDELIGTFVNTVGHFQIHQVMCT
tara:strand:- start:248 stop:466 length:219 start_codon:yes stop_codon:yes gene_type:complete